ncbi:MAG: class I SAM-dependent methyltransferase [Nitrospiraceae bacterium]
MNERAFVRMNFFLALLLALTGCAQVALEQMNDPSRDAWQQPKAVIDALAITPGERVADLGAGGGYFTFLLAKAVGPHGKIYAVDVEDTALRMIDTQAKAREADNVELVLATPNDPRLPPSGVDLIFTCNTYHHLHDRIAYFTSLAPHLRPEGRIAILDYKEGGWLGSLFGHATSKETVRREMESAGYRLVNDIDFLAKQHFQVFRPARS